MQLISIHLKNFQAHEDLEVSFSPNGITTIRGATDCGKSAVIRALNWVCLNNIVGDEFVRHGSKFSEVTLTVRRGDKTHVIVRKRNVGGSINTYTMDEKEYRAFGLGVPDEISAVLGLNEINFQNQHDSPFWFAESSAEVSRRLNTVIDLTVIDTTLSQIGDVVRKAQESVRVLGEQRLANAEELTNLEPQRGRAKRFRVLQGAKDVIDTKQSKWERLRKLIQSIQSIPILSQRRRVEAGTSLLGKVDKLRTFREDHLALSGLISRIKSTTAKCRSVPDFSAVVRLHDQTVQLRRDYSNLKTAVQRAKEITVRKVQPIDDLQKAWKDLQALRKQVADLNYLVNRVSERKLATSALLAKAAAREEQFHKRIKGSICPLCQQAL